MAANDNGKREKLHQLMGLDVLYLLLIVLAGAVFYMLGNYNENRHPTQAEWDELSGKYAELIETMGRVGADAEKKFKQPPIITMKDADGFHFPLSSSDIPADFYSKIVGEIIPQIIKASEDHHLNLVWVMGHTDEVPLHSTEPSTLDGRLLAFLHNQPLLGPLRAVDDTGLAMLRAAAVARVLMLDPRIQAAHLIVIPLSAGQVMQPNGTLSPGGGWDDDSRRRIEIYLRKQGEG